MNGTVNRRHLLAGLLAVALTGGCTPLPRMESAPAPIAPAKPSVVANLLAFQDRLNRSTPADLVKLYTGLNAIPNQTRRDCESVELALLLAQPGFTMRDDADAVRILQEMEGRLSEGATLLPFVRWLRASLQERVKLAASLDETNARLRDEKKRADACNDKLQAIRKMEDSLIERNHH
jgi:hypothetical protein